MDLFVTGGTGYLGRATIGALLNRRHAVRVLTRPTSQDRVPAGAAPVVGDALDSATFADALFTTPPGANRACRRLEVGPSDGGGYGYTPTRMAAHASRCTARGRLHASGR